MKNHLPGTPFEILEERVVGRHPALVVNGHEILPAFDVVDFFLRDGPSYFFCRGQRESYIGRDFSVKYRSRAKAAEVYLAHADVAQPVRKSQGSGRLLGGSYIKD